MAEALPQSGSLAKQQNGKVNRRGADRVRRRVRLAWRMLGEPEKLMTPGEVHDFSQTGLALRLHAPVRGGTVLVVQLKDPRIGSAEPFLVRTRHVRVWKEGGWLAGCSFTHRFAAADFEVLLRVTSEAEQQRLRPCGLRESRATARAASVKWLPMRLKPVNLLRREVPGRLRDQSTYGLGLVSLAAFPAGTLLNVRADQSQLAAWVQVRVRYCRPHERQWLLGCQFTEEVPQAMRAQFIG